MSIEKTKITDTVWVTYIDFASSPKVKVFTTEKLARKWLHDYVVANWNPKDFGGSGPCKDPEDAIEVYFEVNDEESWWIEECPIIGQVSALATHRQSKE